MNRDIENEQIRLSRNQIGPLLKWAGGKGQIVYRLISLAPKNWVRYFEPFLGGGAFVAELYSRGMVNSAVLSDKNPDIYNLLTVVRDHPMELIQEINDLRYNNSSESYYDARDEFNSLNMFPSMRRAALLIYLNRHCFNGLYRLNSSGKFNVPFGRYKNPHAPPREVFLSWSVFLKNVELKNCDFSDATRDVSRDDFVYLDPPYFPVTETSNFTHYLVDGFSFSDQIRLAEEVKRLDSKGAYVMLSNSDTSEMRKLYSDFNVHLVEATRNINSNPEKRSGAKEIIVTNY